MDLKDFVGKMVKQAGFPFHMGTDYCKQHKKNNRSCKGCESEKGCEKVARIITLILQASCYIDGRDISSFEEYLDIQETLSKKVVEVLED